MIRPIVIFPHPILETASVEVEGPVDPQLINDMEDTLEACPNGAALAAVQIGVPKRLVLMKVKDGTKLLVNPVVVDKSEEIVDFKEGCLSMPGIFETSKRHKTVTVEYEDEAGIEKKEIFKNFEAFVIQHEMEHLNGQVFTQNADKTVQKRVLNKMKKWKAKGIWYPTGANMHNALWSE